MRAPARLLAEVDDTEERAAGIGEDHKVRILGVLPIDAAGSQGDEAFHLGQLFLFGVNPEVEVCPVVLIEMDTRSLFLSRNQERGVCLLYTSDASAERSRVDLCGLGYHIQKKKMHL